MAHLSCTLAVVLLLQSQPYQSPIPLVVLALTIVGAVVDYKYKKAGGRRPSKRDRILFLIVSIVIMGFIVWADSINPAIAAEMAIPLVIFTLFAWEVGRWRMRRKYPLAEKQQLPSQPLASAPRSRVGGSLTNGDVLAMLKVGLGSEILIAKIKTTACSFETSPLTLKELKDSGIPDSIILAMVQAPKSE